MKAAALSVLICPACSGRLRLRSRSDAGGEEVLEGWLGCDACPEQFPIIAGVPRLLLGELREQLRREHPRFFRDSNVSGKTTSNEDSAALRTARSFGYEWRHFSDIRPEGETNFRQYFEFCPPERLQGRTVLDVGCGKGRHLYYAGRYAGQAVGVDLSPAVEAAFANTRHLPNVHIVQADIFRLPLREKSFDVVYSMGVLHHLPDPEQGFRRMLAYGKPGADVLIYLYWSLRDQPTWKRMLLGMVTAARKVTTRLPFGALRMVSLGAAIAGEICFVLPYRALRGTRWREAAEKLPLKEYARYPFRVLYQDQFDRFSAPIEHRYERAEVLGWLERAGLQEARIRGAGGWHAAARIPQAALAERCS